MGLFRRKREADAPLLAGAIGDPLLERGLWHAPAGPELMGVELGDLVLAAIDEALGSAPAGTGPVPLLLLEGPDGRHRHRFPAESSEQGTAQARAHLVGDAGWLRAALACAGRLDQDGEEGDAVHVLGWDRGTWNAVHVAQRYRTGDDGLPLERVHGPVYLGGGQVPGEPAEPTG